MSQPPCSEEPVGLKDRRGLRKTASDGVAIPRRQRAKVNRERYEQYLRWSSVKAGLAIEGFYTETSCDSWKCTTDS